jgi:hypothetical protein
MSPVAARSVLIVLAVGASGCADGGQLEYVGRIAVADGDELRPVDPATTVEPFADFGIQFTHVFSRSVDPDGAFPSDLYLPLALYRDGAFVRELRLVPRGCYDACQSDQLAAAGGPCPAIVGENANVLHDGNYEGLNIGDAISCDFADGTGYSAEGGYVR